MKLNLTVYQREVLAMEAGGLRGACAIMHTGIKVREAVALTDEEKKKVGYVATPSGPHWNDTEYRAGIEIKDREALGLTERLVRERIERHERAEDWTMVQFKELSDLAGQLKLDFDAIIAEVEQEKEKLAEADPPAKESDE